MFLDIDKIDGSATAAVSESGGTLTYGALCGAARDIGAQVPARVLVFALCRNTLGSLAGYFALMSKKAVPLLLDSGIDAQLLRRLMEIYRPQYIWQPVDIPDMGFAVVFEFEDYRLLYTGHEQYPLHDDLALLITTSGSTGSPKLVRQSYKNLESNTESIVKYLEIGSNERPITTLPMNYVYGLSVINSHLFRGAALLMTDKSITQREFWQFFREYEATSIAGVPYTYEMLKRMRFFTMKLPSLVTMTQAGGKLLPELHEEFARYASDTGRRFIVMYGAAEATARMGYLPADKALEKRGSMGIPIPGGTFELIGEDRRAISEPNTAGELVYTGDNVTMGYAECAGDLQKGAERSGKLETGDMAMRDVDGYYYVVGRKTRFLKIFGNRVSLDETERMIKSEFPGLECVVCGRDDLMSVFVTDGSVCDDIIKFLSGKTALNRSAFRIMQIDTIPKNEAGKVLYQELEKV